MPDPQNIPPPPDGSAVIAQGAIPPPPDGSGIVAQGTNKQPSVGDRIRSNFLEGVGVTNDEGAKNFFEHPINTVMGMLDQQGQLAVKAKQAYQAGDYKGALMYGLNYLAPFVGPQTARAGEQLNEGDIAGGIARTAGVAVPLLAASPEVRGAVSDVAAPVARAVKPAVAATARAASDIVDPDITAMASPRLAAVQRNLGRLADALEKSQKAHATVTASDDAVYPGANLPATPEPATLQAGALQRPGATPPELPAAALGQIPVRRTLPAAFESPSASAPYQPPVGSADNPLQTTTAPAQPQIPAASPAEVQQAINDALGGKPLQPNVPLRQQMQSTAPKPGELPEGFTPVDSSVLKGYKYDPQTHEFTAITQNGQTYTHGEVTPDQVAAFENADSQGRAWTSEIRNSSPLVKKNGLPVKTATMANTAGEIIPKSEAGMQDLTDILQQSLEQARAKSATIPSAGESNARPAETAIPAAAALPSEPANGRVNPGAAVYEPRQPELPTTPGALTEIRVAGQAQPIPGQFEVRELSDVQPSHSGITGKPNPKYLLDRANLSSQHDLANAATGDHFNSDEYLNNSTELGKGPLVIDASGHPLGTTNEDAMVLQRVYRFNPEGAAAYKMMLFNKAPQFGLDPLAVSRMKEPVLVRKITTADMPHTETPPAPEGEQSRPFVNPASSTTSPGIADTSPAELGKMSPAELQSHLEGVQSSVVRPEKGAGEISALTPQETPAGVSVNAGRTYIPPEEGGVYYHVAHSSYRPGSDIVSFDDLAEAGKKLRWQWEDRPETMHSADRVSLVDNIHDAVDFQREFGGKVIRVEIPANLKHFEDYSPDVNVEGYPTLKKVPGEWTTQVSRDEMKPVLERVEQQRAEQSAAQLESYKRDRAAYRENNGIKPSTLAVAEYEAATQKIWDEYKQTTAPIYAVKNYQMDPKLWAAAQEAVTRRESQLKDLGYLPDMPHTEIPVMDEQRSSSALPPPRP